jgi:ubiquinone biosynthesis protein
LWLLILAGVCPLVVAMVFLVVAEALVAERLAARAAGAAAGAAGADGQGPPLFPDQQDRGSPRPRPVPAGRRRAELDSPAGRARLARSVRLALEEAGVTFVKLGQVLSTRPYLLPPEVVEELGRLQDHVAPWDQVEQVLAADVGRPVNEVCADFDREPLAATSVAQVHAARLRSGAEVAVKVQRPAIRTVVERDLDIVARLARSLEARTRWARSIGVRELAVGFADAVREELDFRIEAANMAGVAASADGTVRIPAPTSPCAASGCWPWTAATRCQAPAARRSRPRSASTSCSPTTCWSSVPSSPSGSWS